MIRYCTKCLYPDTKPDLWFDEAGVCSACLNFERRDEVDWEARKREFTEITDRFRSADGSNYDCVVPVSGAGLRSQNCTVSVILVPFPAQNTFPASPAVNVTRGS